MQFLGYLYGLLAERKGQHDVYNVGSLYSFAHRFGVGLCKAHAVAFNIAGEHAEGTRRHDIISLEVFFCLVGTEHVHLVTRLL